LGATLKLVRCGFRGERRHNHRIDLAVYSASGLDFFSFHWHFRPLPDPFRTAKLNDNALSQRRKSTHSASTRGK
jgi:hypothetical protein